MRTHFTGSAVAMRSDPLHELQKLGQSVRLDYVERGLSPVVSPDHREGCPSDFRLRKSTH